MQRNGRSLLFAAALSLPMAAWSASALFTQGAGEVQVYAASAIADTITLFTHEARGRERQLLASVARTGTPDKAITSIKWFARPGTSPGAAEIDLIGLERLYEHVLHEDAAGTFELESIAYDAKGTKNTTRAGPAQGDVLRALATARERAARELAVSGSALKPRPWGIVSIQTITADAKADPDLVTVRVQDARGQPIGGATLTASRGADTICSARSDASGRASCKLIDAHAHAAGTHDDDDAAPIIVTFPGVVSPDRIELPTTLKISPAAR